MNEETLEKLDQEITLNLQKIDSNLSYCFNRITKQIIPRVTQYGTVCEEIMDHASWLALMFQQTGNVELNVQTGESQAGGEAAQPSDSLFPVAGRDDASRSTESSDDDAAEGSTLQRQRRKRKVSLLLQQEFGSSSSMVPSPALRPDSSITDGYRRMLDSSPVKQPDESTNEVPKPGTVIHFTTGG
ncbi:hypothetical protein HG537_0D01600 [Torulaspora globosa]|uniref:DASH complex subunit ASK1 n=1 Tax=Torulaspora globosa TaxID=48254 RepID=A0A7H9HS80_9SACH|nr:hypothetical protein HG537_0D01600 [Torulaspora sp. CBS 2947]